MTAPTATDTGCMQGIGMLACEDQWRAGHSMHPDTRGRCATSVIGVGHPNNFPPPLLVLANN
jgi:hypothetical protein